MKMLRSRIGLYALAVACAAALLWPSPARADRGGISVVGVDIEEPAQRAIIAYNGMDEIIILQTDVKATQETRVVEFMPLPSKPEVSLAPKGCFKALKKIVSRYGFAYPGGKSEGRHPGTTPVQVVVEAQLGPHDVTVVEIEEVDAFVKWVEAFFEKKELGRPVLGDELRAVTKDYLDHGFRFFAFDVVKVSAEAQTVRPLAYEFRTPRLYYPLKVTNLYGGWGTVELFVILPTGAFGIHGGSHTRLVGMTSSLPDSRWEYRDTTWARVRRDEIASLHPAAAEVALSRFKGLAPTGVMQVCKYTGPLRFGKDVWRRLVWQSEWHAVDAFLRAQETGNAEAIGRLVEVPFAFDRKEVVKDRETLMQRFATVLERTKGTSLRARLKDMAQRPREFHGDWLSEFDKAFIDAHPRKGELHLMRLTFDQGTALVIVHNTGRHGMKIAGFSD